METTKYYVKVTFTTSVLGTQPQKDVATEFITSKATDPVTGELPEDELETLPVALEKGTTAFHKLDGKPIMYDYQVRGFLKEAGRVFNGLRNVKNLKSKIDNLVFVHPRQIELHLPEGAEITFCERPLRAETAQGPRTSLARSEELPAGTWFECELRVYNGPISEPILRDLFEYGQDKGFLQWRNGGHGRFEFELEKQE
jgi:hypothetical protein